VRVFASLYLAAELEQAGVVPIAELLAEQRDTLNLTSYQAAAKLDDFATRERQCTTVRAARRCTPACSASEPARRTRPARSSTVSSCRSSLRCAGRLRGSARDLFRHPRHCRPRRGSAYDGGNGADEPRAARPRNTLLAARRLQDQVRRAVDILRDPAIGSLVGARTMQQTIINILGKDAPDVQRLIDSGLGGQAVLEWLATALPRIADDTGHVPVMTPDDRIAVTAALWLRAVGSASTRNERPPDVGAGRRARSPAAGAPGAVRGPA